MKRPELEGTNLQTLMSKHWDQVVKELVCMHTPNRSSRVDWKEQDNARRTSFFFSHEKEEEEEKNKPA